MAKTTTVTREDLLKLAGLENSDNVQFQLQDSGDVIITSMSRNEIRDYRETLLQVAALSDAGIDTESLRKVNKE